MCGSKKPKKKKKFKRRRKKEERKGTGVPWWHSGLRIHCCHCCGTGSIPGIVEKKKKEKGKEGGRESEKQQIRKQVRVFPLWRSRNKSN